MECPVCKGKLQVKEVYYNKDDIQNEVYHNADIACMNDKCSEYGIVKDTVKTKLELR